MEGQHVRSLFSGICILLASLVAGCGFGKVLDAPPVRALTGPAIPVAPVQDPLPLNSFTVDPCGVLGRAEVAALIADPPDKVKAELYSAGYDRACKWDQYRAGSLTVGIPRTATGSLEELVGRHKRDPSTFSHWRELSISGLPAVEQVGNPPVFEYNGSTLKACTVEVGAADTELLEFKYSQVNDAKSQYWGDDRCAVALKAAEFVIGNLRGR
ncbi:DUF3558 domain-containing protein [Amycolatopsis japonica]|uniref:DUF3558 domain-containing protein n=1 Tax=Amycolatopsis japonica TaxID=208439 RepID=UPI0037F42CAB